VYCTNCGNELPPGAQACGNCGTPFSHFPPMPKVPNYLVHSILATLCCCLPLGIVALVYSARVNSKLAAGDVAGALAASASAKTWVIVSFVAGIVTFGGLGAFSFFQR
jgi:hypothetical protein